ncbi:DUF4118 domain-containing protein [Legionella jordanis]|uniref:histidine kinase n=1 Tax=Legionella jordanis TaxID=456 RepID=A0A0W0VFE8_9GAMM|nr:DUF4118 domain-containing protein [Legionella jordanis]KTD18377.1 osmosensitive K+ channel His-kinase sensor [Legionella jordanis]RMX05287.1 DUF4118 domain-containing protein [Legionella jordanis]VEH13277.1 osmosensitive K+ channel His-kinase sensor [Legionella jordanis]
MDALRNQRPDPDALLAKVKNQEAHASRGKLRIYFGACAGVGKTYAMLTEARKLKIEGFDVVVGLLETHGRKETDLLLSGLPVLPRKTISYHGKPMLEFDIDAALTRKPQLILVDELAHSNLPGSRHPKRWQDVQELLEAGIDVFTTLNVQHLESLNDIVGGITNIRISETIPDTIFEQADEVVLVDITADDLLLRLKAGKVYQGPHGELAQKNFFRKGNLIALRELALRRTAERLEEDVQAYRIEQSINKIWKTDTALLACIGEHPGAEYVVRSTARLASQLNAEWHAIHVETPELVRLPPNKKQHALKALKLAEELGATTAILTGSEIAASIISYAKNQNFSKIVLGRSRPAWLGRKSVSWLIAQYAPDFDVLILGHVPSKESKPSSNLSQLNIKIKKTGHGINRFLMAIAVPLITALIAKIVQPLLSSFNVVLLFLPGIIWVSIRLGRAPALLSYVLMILLLATYFIPLSYSLLIHDWQQLILLGLFFALSFLAGHLTANLRYQIFAAAQREARMYVLYKFAKELSGALQVESILKSTSVYIQSAFNVRVRLLLPDEEGLLKLPVENDVLLADEMKGLDLGIAQWAFDHEEPAGLGTDTLPGNNFFYLPLVAPMRTRGLLVIKPNEMDWLKAPEERQRLNTFAALAAIALERVHFIQIAQEALVQMESERIRNSLLTSLSRDLQSPLDSLRNLAESLVKSDSMLTPFQQELAQSLKREIAHLADLVSNLLDMARIKSGELKLNLEWRSINEIIGKATQNNSSHPTPGIETQIPQELPLLYLDSVLIERVISLVLDNACKYFKPETTLILEVTRDNDYLHIMVYDKKPELSNGESKLILEHFRQGFRVDLDIALCGAIVEAHGGNVRLGHSPVGGTAVILSIPLKPAPQFVMEAMKN